MMRLLDEHGRKLCHNDRRHYWRVHRAAGDPDCNYTPTDADNGQCIYEHRVYKTGCIAGIPMTISSVLYCVYENDERHRPHTTC